MQYLALVGLKKSVAGLDELQNCRSGDEGSEMQVRLWLFLFMIWLCRLDCRWSKASSTIAFFGGGHLFFDASSLFTSTGVSEAISRMAVQSEQPLGLGIGFTLN